MGPGGARWLRSAARPGGLAGRAAGLLVLLAMLASSCARRLPAPEVAPSGRERGLASWYGPGFHGKPTASGEPFDMHQMTGAHRTLPFGAWVEVRRLDNGRSVRVRVNDRGPFVRGRIIDLSFAAARALDLVVAGIAEVELRVVGFEPPRGHRYSVQVGAFRERANALGLARELEANGFPARVESDDLWHRVRIGDFSSRRGAEELSSVLRRQGYPAAIVARN